MLEMEKSIMSSNKFTQGLLVLIVLLLTWLSIRPNGSITKVQAAASTVQYKVGNIHGGDEGEIEQRLNALGKDGWSLVTCPSGFGFCIFKR
jgi:hypothetical protein